MTDDEPRYTLDEAKHVLARQECDTNGHDLHELINRNMNQDVVVHRIYCDRCLASFQEVTG